MTQLEMANPATDNHLNVFLYGPPKTGKTMGACTAPGPILLINGDRPNATRRAHAMRDDIREAPMRGLNTFTAVSELLLANEGPAKDVQTVVLDPLGEIYTTLLESLSQRAVRPAINLRGDASVHLERFCRFLCDRPVNVVIVAHEMLQEDESGEGSRLERIPFTTSRSGSSVMANKIMGMVDITGYTGVTVDEETGEKRYMAQTVEGAGRKGGSRFEFLGTGREINIAEWVESAGKELAQLGK